MLLTEYKFIDFSDVEKTRKKVLTTLYVCVNINKLSGREPLNRLIFKGFKHGKSFLKTFKKVLDKPNWMTYNEQAVREKLQNFEKANRENLKNLLKST